MTETGYINTDTLEYPISKAEVISRTLPPNTTPARPFVAAEPYAWVFPTPEPDYDAITQGVRTTEPSLTQNGTWELPWEVYALDPEEAADNLARAIDSARQSAHARINGEYTQRTAVLASNYPEDEQKSWPVQIQEANTVLSGGAEPTPWIDNAAAARGITRESLANLIKAQDTAYRQYHGALTGTRQALRDQIDAVPDGDPASIDALNSIQWPEI